MTVLIFIARAFIAGGFQAAYVYTPEVRHRTGFYCCNGDLLMFTTILHKSRGNDLDIALLLSACLQSALKSSLGLHHLCMSVVPKKGWSSVCPHIPSQTSVCLTLSFYVRQLSNRNRCLEIYTTKSSKKTNKKNPWVSFLALPFLQSALWDACLWDSNKCQQTRLQLLSGDLISATTLATHKITRSQIIGFLFFNFHFIWTGLSNRD